MKYMKQIRDGDITVSSEDSTDTKANHWSLEFEHPICQLKYLPKKTKLLEPENKDTKSSEDAASSTSKEDTFNKQLWSKLSEQWENLAIADDSNSWISEFGDFSSVFKVGRNIY